MKNTNSLFRKMELLAMNMQDLRSDEGHYKLVVGFADMLSDKLNAKKEVVIPAAIFHDIGYYGISEKKLSDLMAKKLSSEEEKSIKDFHMANGAKLAKNILVKLNYPGEFTDEIVGIVLRHDLKSNPKSVEESIVRDSDKLWRYSKKGFFLDVKRRSCQPIEWYNKLLENLSKKDYFWLDISKDIALSELEKRKKEFSNE